MKRTLIIGILFMIAMTATLLFAGVSKVEPPESCAVCGMSRSGFAKSRMLITYEDGSSFGTCSIACVSGELAGKEKKVKGIQVGDYTTEKLIDAKSAVWVINAKKRGIMSSVAKWAFAAKGDADAYLKKNGGKIATWDEALTAAAEEHKSDDVKGEKAGCDCCNKNKK
jgi:copper chaperone NosL